MPVGNSTTSPFSLCRSGGSPSSPNRFASLGLFTFRPAVCRFKRINLLFIFEYTAK